MILRRCAAALLCLWAMISAARAQQGLEPFDHAVCRMIEGAARASQLPVGFLTRLIWRESSFRPGAVSPVGAVGIAQFMPGTAAERGILDPFDPEQAIPKAAHLLADLRRQFGSLGIAAAAYNAGPARVAQWLRGEGDLPAVTRAYVRFVTDIGDEKAPSPIPESQDRQAHHDADPMPPPPPESCLAVTTALRLDRGGAFGEELGFVPPAPWGVQLAGNFSKALALAAYERHRRRYAAILGDDPPMIIGRLLRSRGTRPFYQVRLPAQTRQIAQSLCNRIQAVGGACVVARS